MAEEITKLDRTIDVMYLIHKALRAEALNLQMMVFRTGVGDSFDPFRGTFALWDSALRRHAEAEDKFMTGPLGDSTAARENEEKHRALEGRLEAVRSCLDDEIRWTRASARTQRHLFERMVSARAAQDDHLEEEEAFVLPLAQDQLGEEQQLELARYLLIDDEAENPRWMISWIGSKVTNLERDLVTDVVRRVMPEEVTRLEGPIDVEPLIHKALRDGARQLQTIVWRMEPGDRLQPFRAAFASWATALEYHAAAEEELLTSTMTDSPIARKMESEHRLIEQRLEDLLGCLNEEIGRTSVIARTQRHLFERVTALLTTLDEHIEEEEDTFLPLLRQQLSEDRQLEVARRMMIDEAAEEPQWLMDWVATALSPGERDLLAQLVARFEP